MSLQHQHQSPLVIENATPIPSSSSSSDPVVVVVAGGGGGGTEIPFSPTPVRTHSHAALLHIAESSLETASDLALMVGYKNADELARRGGIEGIIHGLNTDGLRGISSESIATRTRRWGRNALPPVELETFWDFVKESLDDSTMKILIGAAVISLILGLTTPDPRTGHIDYATGWMEGTAILLSVVIVTLVAAINNLQKQAQFLVVSSRENVAPVAVVRDGKMAEISHEEVVVGDLIAVYAGMSLPFDAVLIEGTGYSTNEASMTGEVDDIPKCTGTDPFLVSGTHIVDGCDGLAIVVAVGERSFSGSIAMSTREEKSSTPLQEHLEEMADVIGRFGLAAAVLTFVVLVLKEFLMSILIHGGHFYFGRVFENLTTAVAIVVVAVPEGLPLSVTISLAYSMKRMLDDKNLVRHLAACETMGGATCICTDKTGTLTSNEMELTSIYVLGEHYKVKHSSSSSSSSSSTSTNKKQTVEIELKLENNNNKAFSVVMKKIADCVALNYSTISAKNNKTAIALLDLCTAVDNIFQYNAISEAEKIDKNSIQRFAFSSIRKRGSVVVASNNNSSNTNGSNNNNNNGVFLSSSLSSSSSSLSQPSNNNAVSSSSSSSGGNIILSHYVAGAAELILQKCASYISLAPDAPEGARRSAMTSETKREIEDVINQYASRGWRTLCLALSERKANWSEPPRIAPEDPLTFLAVVGIAEPVRPQVPDAMLACRTAGVRTVMVTGDNLLTAAHIAKICHILSPKDPVSEPVVMEGSSFREKTDEELLSKILPRLCVLARASPLDKKRLVALHRQDADAVVAVTGDGTNDAPALKAADVGFAMNSGSDIAKRSSDIVLLDDNFAGVVKAIVWGRNVRDNIKKFLQFQLTVNGVACLVAFVGALVNTQNLSPLKPVQLLWLNLIMDTFAALALATELPDDTALLSRAPEPRTASMISNAMRTNIAAQGIFQLFVQVALLLVGEHLFAGIAEFSDIHVTIVFNVFVMMQVFNFFNARKLTAFSDSSVVTPSASSIILLDEQQQQNQNQMEKQQQQQQQQQDDDDENVLLNRLPPQQKTLLTSFFDEISAVWNRSTIMVYIIITIFLTQVLIVQFGGKLMSTVPLNLNQWIVCIFIASFSLPVGWWSRKVGARSPLAQHSTNWFNSLLAILTRVENMVSKVSSKIVVTNTNANNNAGGKNNE